MSRNDSERYSSSENTRSRSCAFNLASLTIRGSNRHTSSGGPSQAKLRNLAQLLQFQRPINDHYGAALSTLTQTKLGDFFRRCFHSDDQGVVFFREPVADD